MVAGILYMVVVCRLFQMSAAGYGAISIMVKSSPTKPVVFSIA